MIKKAPNIDYFITRSPFNFKENQRVAVISLEDFNYLLAAANSYEELVKVYSKNQSRKNGK